MNYFMLLVALLLGISIKAYDEILDVPEIYEMTGPMVKTTVGLVMAASSVAVAVYDPTILVIFIGIIIGMALGDTVFYNTFVPYEHKALNDSSWFIGIAGVIALFAGFCAYDPTLLPSLTQYTPKNITLFAAIASVILVLPIETFLFPEERSKLKSLSRVIVGIGSVFLVALLILCSKFVYESVPMAVMIAIGCIISSLVAKHYLFPSSGSLSTDPRNQSFLHKQVLPSMLTMNNYFTRTFYNKINHFLE